MAATKTSRIGLRATEEQEYIIHRAAEVCRKSVSEFILDSACEAAENALLDRKLFFLSDDEWKEFREILNRPASIKPGLQKLFQKKAPWE